MPTYQYQQASNGCYKTCCPAVPVATSCCTRGKQGVQGWTGPSASSLLTYPTGATTPAIPTDAQAGLAVVLYDTVAETLHFGAPSA